jgi:hypothetical protein
MNRPAKPPHWTTSLLLGLLAAGAVPLLLPGCDRSRVEPSPLLCQEFAQLKNANSPRANELLEDAPPVPTEPVSEAEAERLDAVYALHRDYRVVKVKPLEGNRFLLVVEGAFETEKLQVRTESGVALSQRALFSPGITVEVRDGKIRGVKVGLHDEP